MQPDDKERAEERRIEDLRRRRDIAPERGRRGYDTRDIHPDRKGYETR